jgi:hypothetical protein
MFDLFDCSFLASYTNSSTHGLVRAVRLFMSLPRQLVGLDE